MGGPNPNLRSQPNWFFQPFLWVRHREGRRGLYRRVSFGDINKLMGVLIIPTWIAENLHMGKATSVQSQVSRCRRKSLKKDHEWNLIKS